MSYITDFKSAPFAMFTQGVPGTTPVNGYVGTGLNGIPDYSLDTLLNSKWQTNDGRTLTLVSNAAVALVSGVLVQAAAEVTAFQKLSMTVPTTYPATVGSNQILVTNGSTVLNVNQFAGGWAVVASGTGIGQHFQIASHQPAANAATFVVTLAEPLSVALDATSKISLIGNPAKNVIISPATTATGSPVGATFYPIAASTAPTYNGTTGALSTAGTPQYAFVISSGPAAILVDNSVTNVGYPVGVSKVTAGTVGVATLTSTPQIGISMQTLTSANVGMIKLF